MPTELLPLGGLAAALVLFALAGERSGSGRADRGARWARRTDLAVLGRRRSAGEPAAGASRPAGRLALGYHGRRLLRAEHRHALVAFGAAAVGQVGRVGDPRAAGVAGAGGGLLDQDRPAGCHA